jgi:hypothetical protein
MAEDVMDDSDTGSDVPSQDSSDSSLDIDEEVRDRFAVYAQCCQ